jgi:hypothetical protein
MIKSLEHQMPKNRKNSRVFVVQDPQQRNIIPARDFGEIEVILRGEEPIDVAIERLEAALLKITVNDYLLPIGNPVFIGVAFYFALLNLHKLHVLVWDRVHFKYNVELVEL